MSTFAHLSDGSRFAPENERSVIVAYSCISILWTHKIINGIGVGTVGALRARATLKIFQLWINRAGHAAASQLGH